MDGQTSSAASIGECESLACASHGCDVVATVEVLLGQLVRTLEREHQAAQLCRFSVRILGERQLFQHIERSRNAALLKREPSAEVQRIGVVWGPLRTWRGGHASIAGPQADLALPAHSVASLEALAVHAALLNLKSHHIVFHLASLVIVPDSLAVLGEYAQVRSRVNLSIQNREHSY